MEQFLNFLVENPLVVAIAGGVIFVVTLVAVVKRLFGFVLTLALLILCLITAYATIYPNEAVAKFSELINRQEIQETVDTLHQKFEDFKEGVKDSTKKEEPAQ